MGEQKPRWEIINGDCLEEMRKMLDNSVDAVVTDPPYGLSFMGKKWDYDVPATEVWAECLRVLKPGGHLLSFAGTRTQHRMAVRIEDAGFEIRDMIAWCYSTGFPKSLDVSKAIDKAAGAEREIMIKRTFGARTGHSVTAGASNGGTQGGYNFKDERSVSIPATEAAKQWSGWGTALKPAMEPITVARKPLIGTVAQNVLEHGTGALNIDGCRVGTEPPSPRNAPKKIMRGGKFHAAADTETEMSHYNPTQGRWPANLIHDGSEETTEPLGQASRYFYCAKASKKDRDEGLDRLPDRLKLTQMRSANGTGDKNFNGGFTDTIRKNVHPTVKPTDLMRYLCRLVTPPNGTVLDPFAGSGSTGKGAVLEGFNFIGIEREAEYCDIARSRIAEAERQTMSKLL